eukprot:EG_transcript_15009
MAAPSVGPAALPSATEFALQVSAFGEHPEPLHALLAKFIFEVLDLPDVQLQVRVGTVMDPDTNARVRWPIRTSTVLDPAAGMHHFSGRVSEAAYHHLHQYLTAQHREALRITGQSACISYAKSTRQENVVSAPGDSESTTVVLDASQPPQVIAVHREVPVEEVDVLETRLEWDVQVRAVRRCAAVRPRDGVAQSARLCECHAFGFDAWRVELCQARHYPRVTADGLIVDRHQPSHTSHEVTVHLDAEAVAEQKRRAAARQPNDFAAVVATALRYAQGLAREASRVRATHIGQLTAQQDEERRRQQQQSAEAQQEELTAHFMAKQLRSLKAHIQEQRQHTLPRKRPRDADPPPAGDAGAPAP